MTLAEMTLAKLLDATLRTILIAALAGLGLSLFRVGSSTLKLAVWRLVLYASLLMPLVSLIPKRAVVVTQPAPVARVIEQAATRFTVPALPGPASTPIDWQSVGLRAYALIAGLLLLRAALGLLRLRQLGADAIAMPDLGHEVYEASHLTVPVTYGFWHPRILLPDDWHNWSDETLDAVLAHERSHIAEHDFLTQCLSKVNRALYWANPIAWWLDRQLAQLAEHASDDAALNVITERPTYAAMLLGFAERGTNVASAGVAMARTGGVASRIDRILDEARLLSNPLSPLMRFVLAAVVFTAVIAIGACKMSTVAEAQANPPKPPKPPSSTSTSSDVWWSNDHNQEEWVLTTPHGTSMSGSNGTRARARSYQSRTSSDYLWFMRDGKEYLIDDPKTIAEIESWFKPMEELGRQQGELGEKQGALGDQMGKLGDEMGKLGDQMSRVRVDVPDLKRLRAQIAELQKLQGEHAGKEISMDELSNLQSRLGEMQSLLGEAQSRAGEKQSRIGEQQSELGERQSRLGEQQAKLGEQQAKLGEQQSRIAEEAEKKLKRLFDESIRDGRAKVVR